MCFIVNVFYIAANGWRYEVWFITLSFRNKYTTFVNINLWLNDVFAATLRRYNKPCRF